ncbi:MAG: DUF1049 domain-containing protein [Acidimicrobiales bacterium]|nr:DUF1049 domain-containing protein [Acidimicrobiales bacterium]
MATNPGSREGHGRTSAERRSNREIARIVVAALGLVVLIAFVIDNSQTVKVGFVVSSRDVSLIWVILISAVLGAAVDRLVILLRARRRARAAAARTSLP